jgi:hypothetical protein
MSDAKDADQIKALSRVLVGLMPQARMIATQWAERLYDHGVRMHPELADDAPPPVEPRPEITPEVRAAAEERAWATLREMGQQFPYLAPMVRKIEAAQAPAERAQLLAELRSRIQPEVFEAAQQQAEQLRRDSTE